MFAEEKKLGMYKTLLCGISTEIVFPFSIAILFLAGQMNVWIFSLPYSLLLDYSVLGSLPYPTLPEIEKPLPFRACLYCCHLNLVLILCFQGKETSITASHWMETSANQTAR